MANKKALYITDTHGIRYADDKIFDIARQRSIDTIIFGGDLTPKKISVKLKDQEEIDEKGNIDYEEEKTIPGEIIPLALLIPSEHDLYLDSLLKIRELNSQYKHPDQLEEEEIQRGSIIYRINSGFYDLEGMILEHQVLTKLIALVSSPGDFRKKIRFSKDEMACLDDFLHFLKEIEEYFPPEKKKRYEQKWNDLVLGKGVIYPKISGSFERKFYFSELAPSQNIMLYLLYGNKMGKLKGLEEKVTQFVKRQNSPVGDLVLRELANIPIRARLASALIEYYDVDLFRVLIEETSLQQLKRLAEDPEVCIQGQKEFINGYFRKKLGEFKGRNPNGRVYAILGNDDRTEIEEDVKKLHDEGLITYISKDAVELGNDLFIAGYPHVKDSGGRFYGGWEKTEDEIKQDLEALAKKSNQRKTIYVCHSPPYNGTLDIASGGEHIGSRALAEFISSAQPLAVLSGHVHESYRKSGQIMEKRGATFCFNPGADHNKDKLRAIIFDLDNIENYEVIKK